MQGSVRAQLGITSEAISQRRVSEASNLDTPPGFQARTFDTLQQLIPYHILPLILDIKATSTRMKTSLRPWTIGPWKGVCSWYLCSRSYKETVRDGVHQSTPASTVVSG